MATSRYAALSLILKTNKQLIQGRGHNSSGFLKEIQA